MRVKRPSFRIPGLPRTNRVDVKGKEEEKLWLDLAIPRRRSAIDAIKAKKQIYLIVVVVFHNNAAMHATPSSNQTCVKAKLL